MSGYALIYSDSKLKINPNGPLMWTNFLCVSLLPQIATNALIPDDVS
jgi:hypothetical protein